MGKIEYIGILENEQGYMEVGKINNLFYELMICNVGAAPIGQGYETLEELYTLLNERDED